jgi:hypothetical protein
VTGSGKGKGKGESIFQPRTGHKGPKGEKRYNSTLSLTSALGGVGGQRHAPAALPPGKRPQYPLHTRLSGPQGWSGQVQKISPPPRFDPRTFQPVASRYTDCAVTGSGRGLIYCITSTEFALRD